MRISLLVVLMAEVVFGGLECSINEDKFVCKAEGDGMNVISKEFITNISDIGQNSKMWILKNVRITSIDAGAFEGSPISNLDLSENLLGAITSRTFEGFTNLTSLDLSNNMIMYVAKDAFVNVNKTIFKELNLGSNKLTKIPGYSLKTLSLTHLKIRNNLIDSLTSEDISAHVDLTHLFLSKNKLTNLTVDVFSKNTKLNWLWLDENSLHSLPENIFESLTKLVHVDLSNNQLTTLPAKLFKNNPELNALKVHHNKLVQLPPDLISTNENMFIVSLENNELTEIPVDFFKHTPYIESIDISRNKISSLRSIKHLNHLTLLNAVFNFIQKIPKKLLKDSLVPNDEKLYYSFKNNPLDCYCTKKLLERGLPDHFEFDIDVGHISYRDNCSCTTSDSQTDCNNPDSTLTTEQITKFAEKCFG